MPSTSACVKPAIRPCTFRSKRETGATLLIRTAGGAADLKRVLRQEVVRLRPGLQVHEVAPFEAFVTQQMIRERLLAALSTFFAVLALLLAVVGMYGVLNYAVTRERREIGLRMALGARPGHVVGLITTRLLGMVGLGALAGIAGGLVFGGAVGGAVVPDRTDESRRPHGTHRRARPSAAAHGRASAGDARRPHRSGADDQERRVVASLQVDRR